MIFFFFISPQQISLARRFASYFVIITNATFNINKNKLSLLVLVCVTNTLKSISIAYCFIEFEFTKTFLFINDCIKNLFFYNNCRDLAVLLGDFITELIAAIIKKRLNISIFSAKQLDTVAQVEIKLA